MYKLPAFTLIELLVVITIVGIIAGIGVPTFGRAYQEYQFFQEGAEIQDLILNARTQSLAGKSCEGKTPKAWKITFDKTNKTVNLSCENKTGEDFFVISKTLSPEYNFENLLVSLEENPATDALNQIVLKFVPSELDALINKDTDPKIYNKMALNLEFGNKTQTICFDRIQTFPVLQIDNPVCP